MRVSSPVSRDGKELKDVYTDRCYEHRQDRLNDVIMRGELDEPPGVLE